MAASGRTYDVFISHAGPQKASFAAWLQRELQRRGVSAFLDERSLRPGDAADVEMESALRSCSIVVAVLTKDFLRSSYCMQELHWALHPLQPASPLKRKYAQFDAAQQQDSAAGQLGHHGQTTLVQRSSQAPVLMPVFYGTSDIDGLQMQLQQELAAAADEGPSSSWAQQCVADFQQACRYTGDRLDSHGKLDVEHVDAIVTEVLRRLRRPRFCTPTYTVDLSERTEALLKLLHPEAPGGVCVLSLHGMGGIGKTMLARELYSRLSSCGRRFSREVFLEVGLDADLVAKQRRLLKLLAGSGAQVPKAGSPAEQTAQLRREVREGGALLLALDSLWSPEQRDALLPLDALPQGSRVLLTSRSADNLLGDDAGPRGTARRVAVEFLPPGAARRLLCMHGFGKDAVPEGFAEVVRRALAVCSGLPLALEAVGSGLRCKMPADSEGDLMVLLATVGWATIGGAATRSLAVTDMLRWSYERLPSDNHRHMFLDAALMLKGRPLDHLLEVWVALLQQQDNDGSAEPRPLCKLQKHVQRMWSMCKSAALVSESCSTLNTVIRIEVHDCMVEMARTVAESHAQPHQWTLNTMHDPASLPRAGSAKAIATRLRCGVAESTAKAPWTLDQLLRSHPQCQVARVELQRMVSNAERAARAAAAADAQQRALLYLRAKSLPRRCSLGEQLRVLDLSGCSGRHLEPLLNSIGSCSSLRILHLADAGLERLPDSITRLASLEQLDLSACCALQALPASIGRLSSLQHLDVSECALEALPCSIGSLAALQRLHLAGCRSLEALPDTIGRLHQLQWLSLRTCIEMCCIPDTIVSCVSLQWLDASNCHNFGELPAGLGRCSRLQHLDLSSCTALRQLPDSVCDARDLQLLDLGGCAALQQLPEGIGRLSNLQKLSVQACTQLPHIPESISSCRSLQQLDVRNCHSLQKLPAGVSGLTSLNILHANRCEIDYSSMAEPPFGKTVFVPPTAQHSATVFLLHGAKDSGTWFSYLGKKLQMPHVRFVFPTAPERNMTAEGGTRMTAWFDILDRDFVNVRDEAGIQQSVQHISSLIREEIERFNIPAGKIVLAGFSQGGYVALRTALALQQPLAGVVGTSTWCEAPKEVAAELQQMPVFLGHGARDSVLGVQLADATARGLGSAGLRNVELHVYPEMGHGSCKEQLRDVRAFLLRVLPPGEGIFQAVAHAMRQASLRVQLDLSLHPPQHGQDD